MKVKQITQGVSESEKRMSRAAKGNEKYGKDGMKALAKAGRDGASEEELDAIRDKHDNYDESIAEGDMVGKVSQVKPDGTVEIQKPTGDTTSVQATALQPGDGNKLTVQLPKIQQGMEVDSAIGEEQPASDPQMSALQKLLSTAQQPWEQAQIKWRINNLQSQQSMAGEPGAGMGAPVDARGNLIPVLPTKEWMAKNPSIVKQLPNEALPPEMQKPGMIDRMKSLAGIK